MERPNIFDHATSELSQDAMICWLLSCLNSTQNEYRKLGCDFIRFIFKDININDDDIFISPDDPRKQYNHMDVYAVIKIRDTLYPIIFEDKTDTYLHDNQLKKYCENVADLMNKKNLKQFASHFRSVELKWGSIHYIFYKTGYIPNWQELDFFEQSETARKEAEKKGVKVEISMISLENMISFINQYSTMDVILSDYYKYLCRIKETQDFAEKNSFDENEEIHNKCYSSKAGCAQLFGKIFGANERFWYDHQGWASKDLFAFNDGHHINDRIVYCIRFDYCLYDKKSKKYAYAFQLQQYRHEKSIEGSSPETLKMKLEHATYVQSKCKEIIERTNTQKITIKYENIPDECKKSYDGKMLLKIFIADENTPKRVCNYIEIFCKILCDELQNEHKDKLEILIK